MRFLALILCLCNPFSTLFAQSGTKIAQMIATEGTVKALSSDQMERVLGRSSAIFLHDTVVVASNSKAQLKFTDGGLMTLAASTEFAIDSYEFNTSGKKDEYAGRLIKGGFRAASGSIGKSNPDNYEVKTPSATIGLRGTLFEATLVGVKLYCGCESGLIEVSNSGGKIKVGSGAPQKFTYIASPIDKPVALAARPIELNTKAFSPPRGGQPILGGGRQQESATAPGGGIQVESSPTGTSQPKIIISDQGGGCS
jgi:hypothetical protein